VGGATVATYGGGGEEGAEEGEQHRGLELLLTGLLTAPLNVALPGYEALLPAADLSTQQEQRSPKSRPQAPRRPQPR